MPITILNSTPDPIRTMAAAALLCYSRGGPLEAWRRAAHYGTAQAVVLACIESGHESVLEHASFTFGIEGISRACSHQLVRHRIAAISQQSQRYVNLSEDCWPDGNFVRPPSIPIPAEEEGGTLADRFSQAMAAAAGAYDDHLRLLREAGLEGEAINQDARYVLPNACKTNLIWTVNFRELMHVCAVRRCRRAQWEIREVFDRIAFSLARDQAPADHRWLSQFLGPRCQRLGFCIEHKSCGRAATRAEVLAAYRREVANRG